MVYYKRDLVKILMYGEKKFLGFHVRLQTCNSCLLEYYSKCITCIIDEDVKPFLFLEEAPTEVSDRLQVGQVQVHVRDVQAVTLELDLPYGSFCFVGVPAGDDDAGTSHCHGNGSVFANARAATLGGIKCIKCR